MLLFHEIMFYSVALIFFHIGLEFHRKFVIKSRSNIVQQGAQKGQKGQTDTDKCLVVVGLGQVGLRIDATLIACYQTCDS